MTGLKFPFQVTIHLALLTSCVVWPSIGLQFNSDPLLPADTLNTAFVLLDINHIRIDEESLTAQKINSVSINGLIVEAALLSSHSRDKLHREIVEEDDLPENKSLSSSIPGTDAYSGTWHELFGEYGIIYLQDNAIKFAPTFHALSALGAHHAHEITIATSLDNSWVAFENCEVKKIVIASLRPWPIEITSNVLAGYKMIQSLRASECDRASQIMDWRSYAETTPISGDAALTLTPFEIAIIRA